MHWGRLLNQMGLFLPNDRGHHERQKVQTIKTQGKGHYYALAGKDIHKRQNSPLA